MTISYMHKIPHKQELSDVMWLRNNTSCHVSNVTENCDVSWLAASFSVTE